MQYVIRSTQHADAVAQTVHRSISRCCNISSSQKLEKLAQQ